MAKLKDNPSQPSSGSWNLEKTLPWLLIIGGLITAAASLGLSIEVFNRLKDPSFVPVCNLNPILSCTDVADSPQSHVFGFPNYFLGLAGYGAVVAIGLAMLAGGQFKKWFWRIINIGLLLATIFLHWLIFQTLYRIGALCIFCMVVWVVTIPMFWYALLYSLRQNFIATPKSLKAVSTFSQRHHGDILLVWFLVITALIIKRFWYYWSSFF